MNRREFLMGTASMGAAAFATGCMTDGSAVSSGVKSGAERPCGISVFLADLHVDGVGAGHGHSKESVGRIIDEILAMSPRPDRVVCFGDISCSYGLQGDYVEAKRILSRLTDAGIKVHFVLGNHDRRSFFFEQWPECAKNSPVPGRCVSVVDLGAADLVLLDALKGTDDRGLKDMGPVEGGLDDAQLAWFEDFIAKAKRPFFVGSHQFTDLYLKGASPIRRAGKSPWFSGWIYGHDHQWLPYFHVCDWRKRLVKPTLCLPSAGLWGDIGYVVFKTFKNEARAELAIRDFYFNKPRPTHERPRFWDMRLEDIKGGSMRLPY